MTTEAVPSPRRGDGHGEGRSPRVYRRPISPTWWIRNGHYFWYVVREFTSVPLAIWLLWLLYDIRQAGVRPVNFHPPTSPLFVAFSVIVLLFALYHSVTFLSLAGTILHFKVLDRPVPSRLIVLSQFAMWLVASVVIAFVLVWFAR